MNADIVRVIEEGLAASLAGTGNFGAHVAALIEKGVERYSIDYQLRQASYFLPSGETHVLPLPAPELIIGDAFDVDEIIAAIRGSQAGQVKYPEFLTRSMRAGCVGYVVWIAGRHVTYFGRRGEQHLERFPSK